MCFSVKDCSEIILSNKKSENNKQRKILENLRAKKPIIFLQKNNHQKDPVVYSQYNGEKECWYSGRYIGSADFEEGHFVISPRFGIGILARLLNLDVNFIQQLNIPNSPNKDSNTKLQHLLYAIIAARWEYLLSKANIYGLPRIKQKKIYKDIIIRGHLLANQSVFSILKNNLLVSSQEYKTPNTIIASILMQAYILLKQKVTNNILHLESSVRAFEEFSPFSSMDTISFKQYQQLNTSYNALDIAWKPVVDLSWEIIQFNKDDLNSLYSSHGKVFFLDMAAIWENYLREKLQKALPEWKLWTAEESRLPIYQKCFFRTKLIPDIVLERNGEVIILDAKYKKMTYSKEDVDREDLFQIHTYIQYFRSAGYKVKIGGLIYPLQEDLPNGDNISKCLLHEADEKTIFLIDGIKCSQEDKFEEFSSRFCNRIVKIANNTQFIS